MDDSQSVRLYRRGAALTLVRGFLLRDEMNGVPCSRPTPVVVFAGAGKTVLLAELASLLGQNAPCARIDCEDFTGGTRDLLAKLAFELSRRIGRYRELPFPRLITGLVAISGVDLTGLDLMADREQARERVRQALEDRQDTAGPLRQVLGDIIGAGAGVLGRSQLAVLQPLLELLQRVVPGLVLRWLRATRSGGKLILGVGQDWYGHQDRGFGHSPLDVLVDLNVMARRPEREEDRREAASLLWAAFLADLDAAFTGRGSVNWTFNCLALLDNADAWVGRAFLDELVAARQKRGHRWDPLTVVAASRGSLAEQRAPRDGKITPLGNGSVAPWARRDAATGRRWWYPVALPDLAVTDVAAMVDRLELPAGTRRIGLTSAVYRYTDGHPVAVGALLDAIAGRQQTDLAAILDGSAPGDQRYEWPPMADPLLDRLLRGVPAGHVEDLVTCSAARDKEAALRLGEESELLDEVDAAAEVFGARFWRENPSRPGLVLHPLLRRLLLRRLAARPADAKASWTAVHSWLRENALATGDEVGALYHALALGEVEHVSRQLAKAVEDTSAQAWLELLEAVTAAPNALDDARKTDRHVGVLTAWTKRRDVPLAPTGRLTVARWIDTDPLSDPYRSALHEQIHASLQQIAPLSQDGIVTIYEHAKKEYGDNPNPPDEPEAEPAPVSFVPPKSRRGVGQARRRRVLAAVGAVVLAAGAVTGIYIPFIRGGGPALCSGASASGPLRVVQDGGECVGVTDGSFIFDPSDRGITGAEQAIAAENAAAVASKQGYVTVALLDVLTRPRVGSTTPSDVSASRIRDELRGAYLAQYHANHELGLHPEIRVLLANEGSGEQGWRTGWNQLKQLPASGSGELVAVTGMGLSVQPTVDAAQAIGHAGIPMFGAVTTADPLDGTTSPLLARVVPSVADEASALVKYLPKPSRSVLVYDANTADLYTKSLRADFKQAFRASLDAGAGEIPYVPSTLDSALFKKIAQDLCAVPAPPLVFYAGRNSVFGQFLSQLQQEGDCNSKRLTIVTGGDADGLPPDTTAGSRGGAQVSVIYADIENPSLTQGFTHDFQTLLGRGADPAMTDPWLLASYDALTAAANAIEDAEGSKPDPAQVKASDVTLWVSQLNRSAAVAGATGTLQISANGDLENPAIPIIKLAAGRATTLTVVTVK